jgi:hypothetical protein
LSKYCNKCGNSYSNERSHLASCTRQEISCVYPDPNSDGRGKPVTLYRVDGHFKCIRCKKALKRDQNMMVSLSQLQYEAHLNFIRNILVNVTVTGWYGIVLCYYIDS